MTLAGVARTLPGTVSVGARGRRFAIYVRISKDRNGDELGVQRQESMCRKRLKALGSRAVRVYVDNDISATKSKRRPAYEEMIADLRAGVVDAVIVYDLDRLYRKPRELEDFIILADELKLALVNLHGEYDLANPEGRLMARMKGTVAAYEAEQIGRRVKDKQQQNAELGRPNGGPAPWGFRYDKSNPEKTGVLVVIEDEAEAIREAARRLLAGESLYGVTRWLNENGNRNGRGLLWQASALRRSLMREALIGKRLHNGEVIGDAAWPAILDEPTYLAVKQLLTDPARRSTPGCARRYLGTSIYLCGVCGSTVQAFSEGKGSLRKVYRCRSRSHVCRSVEHVDELVEGTIIARLALPDARDLLRKEAPPEDAQQLLDEANVLRARKDEAASTFADGAISGEQLRIITKKCDARIAEIESTLADAARVDILADLVTAADVAATWRDRSLARKRAIVETLVQVRLMPVGKTGGCKFRPESVEITWK